MSHYDYEKSREISKEDPPFASLIMAAGRKADSLNLLRLRAVFPEIINELEKRYWPRVDYYRKKLKRKQNEKIQTTRRGCLDMFQVWKKDI